MSEPRNRYSPLEKHPAHVQAIGMISVEIGNLELELASLLAALLGVSDEIGQTLYLSSRSNMGRLAILENVAAFVLKKKPETAETMNTIITRSKARMNKRHGHIHSAWGVRESDRTKVTSRAVPFLPENPAKDVPITELTDEITKLREVADLAHDLRVIIRAARAGQPLPEIFV